MDVRLAEIALVSQIFPQYTDKIQELYTSDADFRSLCADYFLCKSNLAEFKKKLAERKDSIHDYEEVTSELEKELFHFLLQGNE
jgi:hypothetical protein